jgi:two-component system nitrogen regulation sensor histidine kinase GlnL
LVGLACLLLRDLTNKFCISLSRVSIMELRVEDQPLLDSLNTAVLLVDDALHIRYANIAAESLLKVSFLKLKETNVCTLFGEVELAKTAMVDSLRINQPYTKRHETLQLHDGESSLIDYSVTPFQYGDANSLIIEMQRIDRFLRINREEALTSVQDSSRNLIKGLAHEIKNPLGGIRGAAQLLRQELIDSLAGSETQEFCNIIVTEVDRLRNLVDRLLGPSQLPAMSSLNIHEVLDHVAILLEAETKREITLDKDYDPSIPLLQGDHEQLIQAFLNVARNAMQALHRSECSDPKIILKTRIEQSFTIAGLRRRAVCRIDVIDNGMGIDQTIKERIFFPMISGHNEGAGLGLTIAQAAINRHDGLIECHSIPGDTCFSIYLPIKV